MSHKKLLTVMPAQSYATSVDISGTIIYMTTISHFHKKQFIGLIIVALSLQGLLSLVGYWSAHWIFPFPLLSGLVYPFMWAIRIFLAYELVLWIQSVTTGKHTHLPWIGTYADKAL